MTWTEQRTHVFLDRYALKDSEGVAVESSPEQVWARVARAIADDELEQEHFYAILHDFKFVPGGRILAGAGAETEKTFYNCYVIPVESRTPDGNDSREAIFDTIKTMVDIMSRGGGVGINWSVLRPAGSYLSRISGTSSGPIGWMDVASKAVGEVIQGGSRRGAAMFMIDDWHPDVLKFIEAKKDLTRITNANISVSVSDAFMWAVQKDLPWVLQFPDTKDPAYNTEWTGDLMAWKAAGHETILYEEVPARIIWHKLAESAWDNGEPGVVFLDRYNKLSTAGDIERIISVNPCGEQGLGAYSVCNLGAMNLDKYIFKIHDGPREFVWSMFEKDVRVAVRFLDNVIDKTYYHLPETKQQQMKLRRIGLGVMGLADALIHLGLRYGSPEAVEFTEKVFRTMKDAAIEQSMALAKVKGAAGGWDPSMWDKPYLSEYWNRVDKDFYTPLPPLRNLFLLTQAPTGTTSIVAGVNSGIEPYFAFQYGREDRTGQWAFKAPVLSEWENQNDRDLVALARPLPDYFVTSGDITVDEHIAMQAAAQKYIDSSVSKTINAPNSHTVEDVEHAFTSAYDSGLKGLAYFRDGCGRAQVLTKQESVEEVTILHEDKLPVKVSAETFEFQRQKVLTGRTTRVNTHAGTAYITLNEQDGKPVEVFMNVGKAGTDVMTMGEALGRLVSQALQANVPLSDIADSLSGVGGASKLNPSLPHALSEALTGFDKDGILLGVDLAGEEGHKVVATKNGGTLCPDCGNYTVVREEGCMKCNVCGYSAC